MNAGSGALSRRGLLIGGLELAAAAAAGGCAPAARPAPPPAPRPGSATPTAVATPRPRFDLAAPAAVVLRGVVLHERHRVMQGVAFDTANRRMFLSQRRDGRPGADLCINQVGPDGRLLAHLHVDDAGHGQSFGVEPVGPQSWLWLEWKADENTDAGRGTALARFPFTPGVRPVPELFFDDGVEVGCAIDPVNRRMLIRRPEDHRTVFTLFDLRDGQPGAVRARFTEPAAIYAGSGPRVLQAFTVLGGYAYTLTGTGGHAGTASDPFDSLLAGIDVTTGEVVQRHLVTAGSGLAAREPEGLAVDVSGGSPRLVFGLASRARRDRAAATANLFALDRLG